MHSKFYSNKLIESNEGHLVEMAQHLCLIEENYNSQIEAIKL